MKYYTFFTSLFSESHYVTSQKWKMVKFHSFRGDFAGFLALFLPMYTPLNDGSVFWSRGMCHSKVWITSAQIYQTNENSFTLQWELLKLACGHHRENNNYHLLDWPLYNHKWNEMQNSLHDDRFWTPIIWTPAVWKYILFWRDKQKVKMLSKSSKYWKEQLNNSKYCVA